MRLIEIRQNQQKEWDDFTTSNPYGHLLQSWEWGEVCEGLGQKSFKLAVGEQEKILGAALVIKHKLPFGKSYLYCPRGPVLNWNKEQGTRNQLKLLLNKIREIAEKEKAIFLKIDPPISLQSANYSLQQIRDLGFVKGQREIQPKCTLILDISLSKEEILDQMRSKTRYNICLSQRKRLELKKSVKEKDVDIFWKLACQTAKRDAFYYHPKSHYRKMMEILGSRGLAKLFIVYYRGKPLAANIVTFFKDTACYAHGASSSEYRNVMAPYFVQWEAICEAKKQGLKYYDFWGISEEIPAWRGITRFKRGFASHIATTCYIGSWDLLYSKFWYFLFNLAHKIRK